MIFDTHMHCDYSCDSEMKFADAIGAAAEQGIGITVTEHWDYDYPTNPEAFIFDIDEYFARLQPLSSDKVLIGIEIGMQTHTAAASSRRRVLISIGLFCSIKSKNSLSNNSGASCRRSSRSAPLYGQ